MGAIPRVIVLGGGLAGLAAALRLAEAEYDVELLEKRSVLGGRASSFLPPGEAETIDNCQHVLLGCCTNLLDFFRRAGTLDRFRFYNYFSFLGPQGFSTVSASALPAPFHLFPSLVRFRDLQWADRWAIARAMWVILRRGESPPDEPMLDWLARHHQTPRAIEHFWRAVLVSALNEDLEHLSTLQAFQVFWESFLRNRQGYRMGVPTLSLSALYAGDLLRQKCALRLGATVVRLETSEGKIRRLHLLSGEQRSADFFVSALPPDALANLFPERPLSQWPELERLAAMEWSPITGIHLWFDRPVLDIEHTAVLGRTIQWVFNKSAISANPSRDRNGAAIPKPSRESLPRLSRAQSREAESRGQQAAISQEKAGPQYIQLVISASRALMSLRRDEILDRALQELQELFPATRMATLQKAVVVKEAKATLTFPPGADAARPGPDTPFANLFLAGDWTRTGWPPTMEAAVRSGYRAAERVTEAAGAPQTFLQPDLPADPLVRFLCRW